jgi:SOS-response transcriptional repressors (RecA-mediated autopeptidases)
MSIGAVIAQKRREKALTQQELAKRLENDDIHVSLKAVSKWEQDAVLPNAAQFLALCRALEIHDVLGEFLGVHSGLMSGLTAEGRARVTEYAQLLRESRRFGLHEERARALRRIRLYDLPVSAGPGTFLDSEGYEEIELPTDAPEAADYALRISGTSMEPVYHDGQIVWVKEQNSLQPGEIGVFVYDGCSYIKQLRSDGRGVVLHSLNPENGDIPVSDSLPLQVMGKLL